MYLYIKKGSDIWKNIKKLLLSRNCKEFLFILIQGFLSSLWQILEVRAGQKYLNRASKS